MGGERKLCLNFFQGDAQLIQSYTTDEVISKIAALKQADFNKVLKRIFETVF